MKILYFLSWLLWVLRWPTVTGIIRNSIELKIKASGYDCEKTEKLREFRRDFTDFWSLFGLVLSVIAVFAVKQWIVIIGFIRLYEIFVCQMSVLFITDQETSSEKAILKIPDARRLVLIGLLNYSEVVLWFSAIYRIWGNHFHVKALPLDSAVNSVFFSLVTMTTLGYGDIRPITQYGAFLVSLHLILGIFLALMVLARFVAALSLPTTGNRKSQPIAEPDRGESPASG